MLENWLYLKNEQIASTYFLHGDTDSQKSKADQNLLGGYGQKLVWPDRSRDSKIDCISKTEETLTQMFSCEFCEIFKNTFFTERLC